MKVSDTEFVSTIKTVMQDVVIPAVLERVEQDATEPNSQLSLRIEVLVREAMAKERDVLWKQFCQVRHDTVIHRLQAALGALTGE